MLWIPVLGQQGHNDPSAVAFSAGLTHDQQILHAETVIYDRVFVNVGNGYNATTGQFICPTSGIYVFQVSWNKLKLVKTFHHYNIMSIVFAIYDWVRNGYNATTGQFICPTSGMHVFQVNWEI